MGERERERERERNLSIHEADESGEGHGGLVDFAHEKPLQYHCIELASCPTHQEPVELQKEIESIDLDVDFTKKERERERCMYEDGTLTRSLR